MKLDCKHSTNSECNNNSECEYRKSPWVCFFRFHGRIDQVILEYQKKLSKNKGNCPLDNLNNEMTCNIHKDMRNGILKFCECEIRNLINNGCKCGGR